MNFSPRLMQMFGARNKLQMQAPAPSASNIYSQLNSTASGGMRKEPSLPMPSPDGRLQEPLRMSAAASGAPNMDVLRKEQLGRASRSLAEARATPSFAETRATPAPMEGQQKVAQVGQDQMNMLRLLMQRRGR